MNHEKSKAIKLTKIMTSTTSFANIHQNQHLGKRKLGTNDGS